MLDTFGTPSNRVRTFVQGGYSVLGTALGDISSVNELLQIDFEYFKRKILPTISERDTVIVAWSGEVSDTNNLITQLSQSEDYPTVNGDVSTHQDDTTSSSTSSSDPAKSIAEQLADSKHRKIQDFRSILEYIHSRSAQLCAIRVRSSISSRSNEGSTAREFDSEFEQLINYFRADAVVNLFVPSTALLTDEHRRRFEDTSLSSSFWKYLFNSITTTAHILSGYVYDNVLINLRISNQKLYQRAVDIIHDITQLTHHESERTLLDAIYTAEDPRSPSVNRNNLISGHILRASEMSRLVPTTILCAIHKRLRQLKLIPGSSSDNLDLYSHEVHSKSSNTSSSSSSSRSSNNSSASTLLPGDEGYVVLKPDHLQFSVHDARILANHSSLCPVIRKYLALCQTDKTRSQISPYPGY